MRDTVAIAREARIGAEFGLAELLHQLAEGAVIAHPHEDVAVARRKHRIRNEVRMFVAGERRRFAMEEIVCGVRMHDRETGFIECGLEELTLAGSGAFRQRHQNTGRGIKPRRHVDECDANAGRAALRPIRSRPSGRPWTE